MRQRYLNVAWKGEKMFRKKIIKATYDKEKERPIIRASICNGEQVAGFKDVQTGKFREVTAICNQSDLQNFLLQYDICASELKKEY